MLASEIRTAAETIIVLAIPIAAIIRRRQKGEQSIPEFVPFVGFLKLDNGTPVFVNARREARHIYDLDIKGHKFRVVKTKAKIEAMAPRDFMLAETPPSSGRRKRKV
jgi:hypothetical protein